MSAIENSGSSGPIIKTAPILYGDFIVLVAIVYSLVMREHFYNQLQHIQSFIRRNTVATRVIFGFDTEPRKKYLTLGLDSSVTGSRPSDLFAALPKMLLIYADIIEPIFTGDIQAKLLLGVSIGGEKYRYGFTEISRFSPPMYIPLLYNSFQTIEIDIKDQHGQPIPFYCGTLTAILHFKRMDQ
ncbi:hypothetical protein TKK_0001591 [Trichogramma kaykai]